MAALKQRRPPQATAPPQAMVEQLVRALTLPGASPAGLADGIEAYGDPARAAALMIRIRLRSMDAAARDRWEGWSARAMATVERAPLRVLVRGYDGYPGRLESLDCPPPVLFARGRLSLLAEPIVGVVGTRACSEEGRLIAERIAGGLSAAGVVVVSGLARGIDGVAHRSASPRRTIGVLGCGVDVVYPRENERLQEAIGRDGLLLSERPPGTPPYPYLFPERNRIIAALSHGLVVVEAPVKSGALITADYAAAMDRPVFAAPGPLTSAGYAGSNARIREGRAKLVTGPEDVLRDLGMGVPPDLGDRPPPELEGVGLALWRAVGDGTPHADDLADAVGLDPQQGLASLLALEVQGHLRQLPGMRFVRARTAAAGGG